MTKQEILDSINATIVANGQKGITAELLANILTEIVNAAPESSGSGSGILSLQGSVDDSTGQTIFTEEQKANNIAIYEAIEQAYTQGSNVPPIFLDSVLLMQNGSTEDGGYTFRVTSIIGGYVDTDLPEDFAQMGMYTLLGMAFSVVLTSDGTFTITSEEPLF
jgi:hypothetical protein